MITGVAYIGIGVGVTLYKLKSQCLGKILFCVNTYAGGYPVRRHRFQELGLIAHPYTGEIFEHPPTRYENTCDDSYTLAGLHLLKKMGELRSDSTFQKLSWQTPCTT